MRNILIFMVLLTAAAFLRANPLPSADLYLEPGDEPGAVKLIKSTVSYSEAPVEVAYRATYQNDVIVEIRRLDADDLVTYDTYSLDPCVNSGLYEYLVPAYYLSTGNSGEVIRNYDTITVIGSSGCEKNGTLIDMSPEEFASHRLDWEEDPGDDWGKEPETPVDEGVPDGETKSAGCALVLI